MIRAEFRVPKSLHRFLDCLKPAGRHHLFSAAAASVSNLVRRHIAADAPRRHVHALTDGAGPSTGFMEKAARKTVFRADAQHGEVVIPSPGFGRAFHDVEIVPTHGAALTLPISGFSYGRRVKEMTAMGWLIFRPKRDKSKDIDGSTLWGGLKGDEPIPLYILKKRVAQRQDRSLLPSDAALSTTASRAMISEINRISKVA